MDHNEHLEAMLEKDRQHVAKLRAEVEEHEARHARRRFLFAVVTGEALR